MSLVYYVYYSHSGDVTPLRLFALCRIIGRATWPVFLGQKWSICCWRRNEREGRIRMNSAGGAEEKWTSARRFMGDRNSWWPWRVHYFERCPNEERHRLTTVHHSRLVGHLRSSSATCIVWWVVENSLQSGASGCVKCFVKCFLKVPFTYASSKAAAV